jgi:hypothetical protein
MINRGGPATNDWDILAYFTWPNRPVNHRLVSKISNGNKYMGIKPMSAKDLD